VTDVTKSLRTQSLTLFGAAPRPGADARLSAVSAALWPEPDLGAAAAVLLLPLIEWTGAARGSILVLNPATGRLAIVAAVGLREGLLGQESPPRPRSISEWVFRNRRGLILDGEVRDQRFEGSAGTEGIESALSLPLVAEGIPLGVVNLARLSPAPVFAGEEMAALEARLVPVAAALDRVARARAALLEARRIEARASGSGSALLPPGASEVHHFDLALAHRPAAVPAGDLCERVPHAGGDQSLLMLDPPGLGGQAGAIAAFVQGLFVTLAAPERSASGMAARLGAEIHQRLGPRHATAAWVAQLTGGGELSYCNAGHAWPLWIPADGSDVTRLDRGGPLLGALPAAPYEEERLRLLPGDIVLVASDGVLDARGISDQPFGHPRLAELAAASRGLPLERLADGVLDAVVEFSGRPVPTDDLTILALRFHPGD
jgi:phosphoserine phosphatase RsbU/P